MIDATAPLACGADVNVNAGEAVGLVAANEVNSRVSGVGAIGGVIRNANNVNNPTNE